MKPFTLFPKDKGNKGKDLISAACKIGYVVERITGSHHILRHQTLNETLVIPFNKDLRRTDPHIVKKLRQVEIIHNHVQERLVSGAKLPLVWAPELNPVGPQDQPKEVAMEPTTWYAWMNHIRRTNHITRAALLDLLKGREFEVPFTTSSLVEMEAGRRIPSQSELDAWMEIFKSPTPPFTIPICEGSLMHRRIFTSEMVRGGHRKDTPKPLPQSSNTQETLMHWTFYLKEQRIKAGLTQIKLAEILNTSEKLEVPFTANVLSQIENGRQFSQLELDAWMMAFPEFQSPVEIPICTGSELEFRTNRANGHMSTLGKARTKEVAPSPKIPDPSPIQELTEPCVAGSTSKQEFLERYRNALRHQWEAEQEVKALEALSVNIK